MYGPVPINCLSGLVPAASAISFGMIAAAPFGSARNASSGAKGVFIFIMTVSVPPAVTESTARYTATPRGLTFPQRFSDDTTSAAVRSAPL